MNPVVIGNATLYLGDALTVLRELPDCSVQCCVTSPPYWRLRDYGVAGQLGLESTPAEYVEKMMEVFGEVRRVLRDDGTLWLNLGDSYSGTPGNTAMTGGKSDRERGISMGFESRADRGGGLPAKNLLGIPWRVAFALQADGWYLRQDIIWSKPNPMPESVRDREIDAAPVTRQGSGAEVDAPHLPDSVARSRTGFSVSIDYLQQP